jgi:hypothetical protein
MIEVVKMEAAHLREVLDHPAMTAYKASIPETQVQNLAASEYSYAALKDGKPILCAGVVTYWEGRGEAWAFLVPGNRREFIACHNAVKRFLASCPLRRIEAAVQSNYRNGHRWADSLGFRVEAPCLKHYAPDGADYTLYARVKLEAQGGK